MRRLNPSAKSGLAWIVCGLLLAVLVTASFFFIRPGYANSQSDPSFLVIGLEDSGRQAHLPVDHVLSVELPGSLSTGYSWALVNQAPGLQALPAAYLVDASLVGGSETTQFRFVARQAGESELTFAYRRPWEQNRPPLRVFTLKVRSTGAYAWPALPGAQPAAVPTQAAFDLAAWLSGWRLPALDSLSDDLPAQLNWCANGGCTSIKDQGQCQSCWAFATVGVLEQAIALGDGLKKDLSEYYLISCNQSGYSCIGGKFAHEYHWNVIPQGELAAGARYEADYPYNELVLYPRCEHQPNPAHETIEGWAYVDASVLVPSVGKLKQALYAHGPLAVTVCTGPAFQEYTGGVFNTDESSLCPTDGGAYSQIGVNHALLLVGWDDSLGVWVLRNEWGPDWGEDGYMRIKYGVSNVGAKATYILYPGWPPAPTPVVTEPPVTGSPSPSTSPSAPPTALATALPTTPAPATTQPPILFTPKAHMFMPAVVNGP